MRLSLTQQCSSRTLLLLLVSNLLLWEDMASPVKAETLNVSNQTLFNEAIKTSQDMNRRILFLSTHFNMVYAQGRGFNQRTFKCHTSSLSSPENKEQAENIQSEVLLKLVHSLMQAWVNPLYHLWAEMGERLGYTPSKLTKALEIKTLHRSLLKTLQKITINGTSVIEANGNYPAWSELGFMQSNNRDTKYFAFFKLFHCLQKDSECAEMLLKLLNCRLFQRNC
ncbi:prolactin-4A1-like [Acomys russatus]|uniref:prolactin-4A1-like n=1 Tax=Acomys russatus TaxID=60746 RepID=UPI0021E2CB09|nr:prolactin-4A1-like [Acomys russatus]